MEAGEPAVMVSVVPETIPFVEVALVLSVTVHIEPASTVTVLVPRDMLDVPLFEELVTTKLLLTVEEAVDKNPPKVVMPEITVELAVAFLIVSPERSVSVVVVAPPRNVARPENEPVVAVNPPVDCNAPEITVELAVAFLIVSPERSVI